MRSRWLACTLLLAACGGGGDNDDSDDTGGDDVTLPDARVDGASPDGTTGCAVEATITATTALVAGAKPGSTGPKTVYEGSLNADGMPDILDIQLWEEAGVFAGGVTTGTFPLTGLDASYLTCDACVRVFGDLDTTEGSTAEPAYYQATAGSITLTNVTDRVTGTLSNVAFQHVDYTVVDDDITAEDPSADACMSTLATFSFDAAITPDGTRTLRIPLRRER